MDLRSGRPVGAESLRPQMACAQCGELLFMPEWSETVDEHRVRHLWQCVACDYAFETVAHFAEAA